MSEKPFIEYEGPHPPIIARKSEFQQLSEQIAALRDGLIKRADEHGAKLDGLSTSQRTCMQQLGSLEQRIIDAADRLAGLETGLGEKVQLVGAAIGKDSALMDEALVVVEKRLAGLESKLDKQMKEMLHQFEVLSLHMALIPPKPELGTSTGAAAPKQKQRRKGKK